MSVDNPTPPRAASSRAKSKTKSSAAVDAAHQVDQACPRVAVPQVSSAKTSSRPAAKVCAAATASATPLRPESRSHAYESRQSLARDAEDAVARRLEAEGFVVLGQNVRAGRYELDIVAQRGALIVICEVRARSRRGPIAPAETITRTKLQKLRRGAARWLSAQSLRGVDVRIDAAGAVRTDTGFDIEYYENVSCPERLSW